MSFLDENPRWQILLKEIDLIHILGIIYSSASPMAEVSK